MILLMPKLYFMSWDRDQSRGMMEGRLQKQIDELKGDVDLLKQALRQYNVSGQLPVSKLLDYVAENYTRVLYRGEDWRWCTEEVAEFGSANNDDYMTTEQLLATVNGNCH